MAQSTAEAGFFVVTIFANQALWLRKVLIDLNMKQEGCIKIFVDN